MVTYQGKEYPTMRALADAFDLNYDRLRARIQTRGWSVDDAVEAELQTGRTMLYKGKMYPSIAALARECNVDYRLLQSRIRKGWDIERAVETEKVLLNATPVVWQGQTYPSISRLAKQLKIPETTLLRAYSETGNMDAAVKEAQEKHRETDIVLWNVEYPSLKNLAASFGINYHVLYPALQRGESLEEAVIRLLNNEPLLFNGEEYACFSDLCRAYKIQPVNVRMRLTKGMSLEDAVETPIRNIKSGKGVCYRGEEYPSRIAMCREYGISTQCVYMQMRYVDTDYMGMFDLLVELKERAGLPKDYQLNYIPACVFHGEPIKSISQLAKTIGVEIAKLYAYKNENGCSEIFSTLKEMQAAVKPVYTIHGEIYTYSQMQARFSGYEIQRLSDARSMIPVFPQLQGIDFADGCIDVLALHREILEARGLRFNMEQELKNQQEQQTGMGMGGIS